MAGDQVINGWTQFFLEVEKLFEGIERKKSCQIVSVIEGLFTRLEMLLKKMCLILKKDMVSCLVLLSRIV